MKSVTVSIMKAAERHFMLYKVVLCFVLFCFVLICFILGFFNSKDIRQSY